MLGPAWVPPCRRKYAASPGDKATGCSKVKKEIEIMKKLVATQHTLIPHVAEDPELSTLRP